MHAPTPGADDDGALIRRSASGDTSAFDVVVDRHQSAVHRFIQTLGCREPDDVLQETFIAAWRSVASYQGTGTVRSWLLSIARNVHRHHRRQRVDAPNEFVPLDALAERAGWGCDPAETRRVDVELARDVLARALAMVPEDEREVLVLRELEGLSGDETAELLKVSVAAMKSRLHRGRIHLAAAVRELEFPHSTSGRDRVTN